MEQEPECQGCSWYSGSVVYNLKLWAISLVKARVTFQANIFISFLWLPFVWPFPDFSGLLMRAFLMIPQPGAYSRWNDRVAVLMNFFYLHIFSEHIHMFASIVAKSYKCNVWGSWDPFLYLLYKWSILKHKLGGNVRLFMVVLQAFSGKLKSGNLELNSILPFQCRSLKLFMKLWEEPLE